MSNGKAAEENVIRALNAQMHAAEKRGADGLGFYRELLDQTLRFRRANGAVATRDEYLIDLANPANRREQIDPDGPIDCTVYENTAIASVLRSSYLSETPLSPVLAFKTASNALMMTGHVGRVQHRLARPSLTLVSLGLRSGRLRVGA